MDFDPTLIDQWRSNVSPTPLKMLADELGVTEKSLLAVGIGFAPIVKFGDYEDGKGRWVFPERDAGGKYIGAMIRMDGREKRAIGKRGLCYPVSDTFEVTPDDERKFKRFSSNGVCCPVCGKLDGCRFGGSNPLSPDVVMCCRVSDGSIKKFAQEWLHVFGERKLKAGKSVLYPPTGDDPILIVEGASDVCAAICLGFVGVGKPSASGGLDLLAGLVQKRNCVVIGENDDGAGRNGLFETLARLSKSTNRLVGILPPSGTKDLREWWRSGILTHAGLLEYISLHPVLAPSPEKLVKREGGKALPSLLAQKGCITFQSQDEYYVSVPLEDGRYRETYPLYSTEFESYLQGFSVQHLDSVLKRDDIHETLVRMRIGNLPKLSTYIRIGHTENTIWLDLNNQAHQLVKIDTGGWSVISGSDSPLHFVRPANSHALPIPRKTKGGTWGQFLKLLHLASPSHEAMISAWLMGLLMPAGTVPILAMVGESGAGKSWTTRAIKSLVDPIADVMGILTNRSAEERLLSLPPKSEYDLFREASNACILGYDNLSYITPAMSDAICALVTGATYKTRRLYTVSDTVTLGRRSYLLLNGIPSEMFERGDLRSRVRIIRPALFNTPDGRGTSTPRLTTGEFWGRFLTLWPDALGELCTAASLALANAKKCGTLIDGGRLQDFYQWAWAGLPSLGIDPALLKERESEERTETMDEMIGTSALIGALNGLWEGSSALWEGTMSRLYGMLQMNGLSKGFSGAKSLSAAFKREANELKAAGWDVRSTVGEGKNGLIHIQRMR